jgi:hypothetical protein
MYSRLQILTTIYPDKRIKGFFVHYAAKKLRYHKVHRFLISIFAFAVLAGFQSPPEPVVQKTPEAILSKAVQSIGGRRELEKIESFQLHGIMRLSDDRPVVEIDLSTTKGGKVLGVMTYIGLGQSRFGSDGETAWEQNISSTQEKEWALIDQSSLSQKVQQINWLEWFTMLPAELSNIQFVGKEQFDEEPCIKLSVKGEDGYEQLVFFSQETFRPRGRRTVEKTPNGDATIDVYFRDWKRVGGLLLFHTVTYNRDGSTVTLKLNRISTEPLPNSLFVIPEQIKQLIEKQ